MVEAVGHRVSVPSASSHVIELGGDIDLDNATAIGDALCNGLHRNRAPITVDLTWVSFIDSTAISMMVRVHNYGETLHRPVTWRGAHGQAIDVLRITGVDQLLHLENTI